MIVLEDNTRVVEDASELPEFGGASSVYCDLETTNFGRGEEAVDPYRGDRICGYAVTVDDVKGAWYVPVRHREGTNVDVDAAARWFADTLRSARRWPNHNVKFDAHFAAEEHESLEKELRRASLELVDTVTGAKIIDSDKEARFGGTGYGLDALAADWLGFDMTPAMDAIKRYVGRDKDYAAVPIDVMAKYACDDVRTARRLDYYLEDAMPEDCRRVWETEKKLTAVLYDVEREGLTVDRTELLKEEFRILRQLMEHEEQLSKKAGFDFQPWNTNHLYELLVNQLGLPVISLTDKGNPSFDAEAMAAYSVHPDVLTRPDVDALLKQIGEANGLHKYLTMFVRPYRELNVDGRLHCSYNQCVTTGRMACSRPNMQQLNEDAKKLIHPDGPEYAFLSKDYSQIEFRWMVHTIKDFECIAAYLADPDTDFHDWVAKMCRINRKPAKTVNFGMGYGAGKKTVVRNLSANDEFMRDAVAEIDAAIERGEMRAENKSFAVKARCTRRAEAIYEAYHRALPTLKGTMKLAANRCRSRGYVFNAYGRRRHLRGDASWRAFNAKCQSDAADVMKERAAALAPRYCAWTRDRGITLRALVHDEFLWHAPVEVATDPAVAATLAATAEAITAECRVPMRASMKLCRKSWADEEKIEVDRTLAEAI